MKKLFTLLFASLLSICGFAQTDISALDDALFVQGTVGKDGGNTATVDLMVKTTQDLATIGAYIYFPEGIKPVSVQSICDVPCSSNYIASDSDGDNYIIILYNATEKTQAIPTTSTPICIGKITVELADDITVGVKDVVCKKIELTGDVTETPVDITENITVQKAAVIEPQCGDYAFEAVPTCVVTGATSMTIPVNFTNEGYVDNISFNIGYPEGMLTTKSGKNYPLTVNTDRFDTGSDATLTVKATSGTAVAFTNAESDLVKPGNGNLLSIPVTLTGVADGVYTIKFTDIKVSVTNDEADPISTETLPDYYVSVIVGQPAAQEAILYGNYSSDVASAFSTALKNVAIADVTVATVAEGAKFNDVLVNEKGGNSYYTRTSANYGTTVLPLDLTAANVDELYMIESMDANSIVLTEAASVSANTPCIFKGTINVEGATPTLGVPSEEGLGETTFKGTYSATNIASGAGYYISSNGMFYSDGASIAPFRGYFEGTISGVKEFRVSLVTPDGLIDITDQFSSDDIYNLQGIRVQNAKKGVNIVGGKKVYVK